MKEGKGIESKFTMREASYIYWNNVNELVDRLRLLISLKSAGHSGYTNEIISIIEKLREENVVE